MEKKNISKWTSKDKKKRKNPGLVACPESEYVAVNFLFQLIFIFHLFMGKVMYVYELKTKGKQKFNYIKKLPDLRESKKSVEFWIPSRGILT